MRRIRWQDEPRLVALAFLVWLLFVVAAWLDWCVPLRGAPATVDASIIHAIVSGIEAIAGWLSAVAEASVAYLSAAVSWISTHLASFIKGTGAMFAKVWDGTKIIWNDALKPALKWLDDHLRRFQTWLTKTFRPVFDFLNDLRQRLRDIYNTFVKPVVDTIEFIRAVNRVLLAFHITFLQKLDATLQQLERRIEEPFLWINQKLNEIWNLFDRIVTADGFFTRLALVRSMSRYAPAWLRIAANARARSLTGGEKARLTRASESQSVPQLTSDLQAYFDGHANDTGAVIDALAADWKAEWS